MAGAATAGRPADGESSTTLSAGKVTVVVMARDRRDNVLATSIS
ncbi:MULTISPECIES: hypothetical protein [unclassified Modestobacter]